MKHEYLLKVTGRVLRADYVYGDWKSAVDHVRLFTHKWPLRLGRSYKLSKYITCKITRRCMDKE